MQSRLSILALVMVFFIGSALSPCLAATADSIGTIVPHIAQGAAFTTEFQIMNLENNSQPFTLNFYDPQGQALFIPMQDSQGQSLGVMRTMQGILSPGGSYFTKTAPGGLLQTGYAELLIAKTKAVAIITIFTQSIPGRPDFQASIPIIDKSQGQLRVPFKNTGGLTTTLAWANANLIGQEVLMIARDGNGVELCRLSKALDARYQDSFVLSDRLACTANKNGLLEVQASGPGIAAIAFLFNDSGAFTTQLPLTLCCF